MNKNILFVLIGSSFRTGNQGSLIRGLDESYEDQINACKSHIKLFDHLVKKFNCNIDTSINTYTTKFDDNIRDIYKNYNIVNINFNEKEIGLTNLFNNAVYNDNVNINNYDSIFYIRIDIKLADFFINLVDINTNNIKFSFICWHLCNNFRGYPRNADMMLYIPKKYFNHLQTICNNIGHELWYILRIYCNLTNDDIDVFINTFHDSDSYKDYNPLYCIANREQSNIWHSKDLIFNKNDFK